MNAIQLKQWVQSFQPSSSRLIMGIVNVTDDSFSQDGHGVDTPKAVEHALNLIAEGADIIDIGGESSRPGAQPISEDEEMARVIPLMKALRQEHDCCISVDTTKASVMREALHQGAGLINDISALSDPQAIPLLKTTDVPIVIMHMHGIPETMQEQPMDSDCLSESLITFFENKLFELDQTGITPQRLILDPGFGFGKTHRANLKLLQDIKALQQWNRPLLLGASRKSTLGWVTDTAVEHRLIPGITTAVYGMMQGVSIIRTHDVRATQLARCMLTAIEKECYEN